MILGLFTSLLTPGGIQRFSRHTASVLAEYAEQSRWPYRFLSLDDPLGPHSFVLDGRSVSFRGSGGSHWHFASRAFSLLGNVRLLYLGHPHFATLGLPFRLRPTLRYIVATYGVEVWAPLPSLQRLGLRRADLLIALSRFSMERLVDIQGADPAGILILPPAVDPGLGEEISAGRASRRARNSVILTVARLVRSEPGKGVDSIISALPRVLLAVPNVEYVVVGPGDDHSRLRQLAAQLNVDEHVTFIPEVDEEQLRAHYASADIFAMPSRQEGFGMVFLEAMQFGLPIIAGCHGGTPEFVVHGVTGYLVEHGNDDEIADYLIRLLQDEQLRVRMGEAGRAFVQDGYTYQHFREKLWRWLSDIGAEIS